MDSPLKITFTVSGGFVPPPYPLHLDAVLAYAATERNLLDLEDGEISKQALRSLADDLPLAKHVQDGEWVWMASAITPSQPALNDSRFYTQRRDKADYAEAVRTGQVQHGRYNREKPMTPYQFQIDTLRGAHRNLLGYYPVQKSFGDTATLELVAYCVGDAALIEEMLVGYGIVTHLGARRRSGHGRIESVEIAEDETALDGWKARVRPWRLLADDVPVQAAWKPPYWATENRGEAFMPVGL